VLNASKEANVENQSDKFDAELLRPIQLNMENHRYVLESSIGPLVASPLNAFDEGRNRAYQDHYRNKKYIISPIDEKVISLADIPPVAEQPIADTIKMLGDSLASSFVHRGKKDCHFFSIQRSLSFAKGQLDYFRVCFSVFGLFV
jgi:hypothetical protein